MEKLHFINNSQNDEKLVYSNLFDMVHMNENHCYAGVYFKYDKFGYKSMLHNSMAIVLHNSINKESYDKLDLIIEQARNLYICLVMRSTVEQGKFQMEQLVFNRNFNSWEVS